MKTILCKEGYLIKKKHLSEEILEKIRKDLTVTPDVKSYAFNDNENKEFPVYQENDKYINIPKFYGLKKYGPPRKNKELDGLSINMKFKGKLRDYQNDIVKTVMDKINENDGGLLSVGCGKGKTIMAIYMACKLKVKTLVIVHKTFLLNQWVERIQQFTNAKIGIVQQDKVDVEGKDIVIGMLQSIAKGKYDNDIFRDFGFTIFDEAHHAPSEFFSKALPIIASKKSLALSATPKRADKLEKVLFWYLGDIAYEAPPDENKDVNVRIYHYKCDDKNFKEAHLRTGDVNRARTLNRIVDIKKRNDFIIDIIKDIMVEKGRKMLILSDRIDHLKELNKRLDELNYVSDFYIGGRTQPALDKAAEAPIIFGSYGMASEALDIPTLNTLIMATPRKEVEQAIGRIIRKVTIQPIVVDIVDELPSFKRQSYTRLKLYKSLNYKIKRINVEDNKILSETCIKNDIKKESIKSTKITFLD